jgi:hypothetical protein
MIVCNCEDRFSELPGIELLVGSLQRHSPDLAIDVTFPGLDEATARAIGARQNVRVRTKSAWEGHGSNTKPLKMLELLDEGHAEVVWMDSDIIATKDVRELFSGVSRETLVVAQEVYWGQHQGGSHRTSSWGMEVGRALPWTANSCVVRVTEAHRDLLRAWSRLLRRPEFIEAQTKRYDERPIHLLGDQEVLSALLGSKMFAPVPLKYLKRGSEIIQQFGPGGYTVRERLGNFARGRVPALIHTQGAKPWNYDWKPVFQNPRAWYTSLGVELSPFSRIAEGYREELRSGTAWMNRKSVAGTICKMISGNNMHLRGLPQAGLDEAVRWIRRIARVSRYRIADRPRTMLREPELLAQLES